MARESRDSALKGVTSHPEKIFQKTAAFLDGNRKRWEQSFFNEHVLASCISSQLKDSFLPLPISTVDNIKHAFASRGVGFNPAFKLWSDLRSCHSTYLYRLYLSDKATYVCNGTGIYEQEWKKKNVQEYVYRTLIWKNLSYLLF